MKITQNLGLKDAEVTRLIGVVLYRAGGKHVHVPTGNATMFVVDIFGSEVSVDVKRFGKTLFKCILELEHVTLEQQDAGHSRDRIEDADL